MRRQRYALSVSDPRLQSLPKQPSPVAFCKSSTHNSTQHSKYGRPVIHSISCQPHKITRDMDPEHSHNFDDWAFKPIPFNITNRRKIDPTMRGNKREHQRQLLVDVFFGSSSSKSNENDVKPMRHRNTSRPRVTPKLWNTATPKMTTEWRRPIESEPASKPSVAERMANQVPKQASDIQSCTALSSSVSVENVEESRRIQAVQDWRLHDVVHYCMIVSKRVVTFDHQNGLDSYLSTLYKSDVSWMTITRTIFERRISAYHYQYKYRFFGAATGEYAGSYKATKIRSFRQWL